MRISGKGLGSDAVNFPAEYLKQGEGGRDIDTGRIDGKLREYIEEAAEAEKYSIAGLCIALGITRETFELWKSGYVCGQDARDKRTAPNGELASVIAKGELYVHRYWEESDKSTTLHTKFLENAGLLGGAKQATGRRPPFDLGRLKKYSG
jgi:hypothetical protein